VTVIHPYLGQWDSSFMTPHGVDGQDEKHAAGTLATPWMGRRGGLGGAELKKDLASGGWRGQSYECRSTPIQNPNWFPVTEFIARIAAARSS
jgi:hypothetical protein